LLWEQTMLHRVRSALAVLMVAALDAACSEDASGGAVDAGPGGLPFLASCTTHEECATGLCFNFNARGLRCTHACQSSADCEEPSPGCNNMRVCKAP
jgi:hypothetical protein